MLPAWRDDMMIPTPFLSFFGLEDGRLGKCSIYLWRSYIQLCSQIKSYIIFSVKHAVFQQYTVSVSCLARRDGHRKRAARLPQ